MHIDMNIIIIRGYEFLKLGKFQTHDTFTIIQIN